MRGLVARAVETDDEAVADQRVVAHALNLHEVLQTFGVGGRGRRQRGGEEEGGGEPLLRAARRLRLAPHS